MGNVLFFGSGKRGSLTGSVLVPPQPTNKIYTGYSQELIIPGTGTGDIYYSMVSETSDFSTKIPEAIDSGIYTIWYYAAAHGEYKKSDVRSIQAVIRKTVGFIELSSNNDTIIYPTSLEVTISNSHGGSISIVSSNPLVATAEVNQDKIIIHPGLESGEVVFEITCGETNNYLSQTIEYKVNVEQGKITPIITINNAVYPNFASAKISVDVADCIIEVGPTLEYGTIITSNTIINNTYSLGYRTSSEGAGTSIIYYRIKKDGYGSYSGLVNLIISKQEGMINISQDSMDFVYPTFQSFLYTDNTGDVEVITSNSNIATAGVFGATIIVYPGIVEGTAILTVRSQENDNYTAAEKTFRANVKHGTITVQEINGMGSNTNEAMSYIISNVQKCKVEYGTNKDYESVATESCIDGEMIPIAARPNDAPGVSIFYYKISRPGYYDTTGTISSSISTVIVSENELTIEYPNTVASFLATPFDDDSTILASSDNTNIASATVMPQDDSDFPSRSGNYIKLNTGSTFGTANIEVIATATANYAKCKKIIKVNYIKAKGHIKVDSKSGIIIYPEYYDLYYVDNTGTVSATSSDTSVATVEVIDDHYIYIYANTEEGTAIITVNVAESDNYYATSLQYQAQILHGTIHVTEIIGDSIYPNPAIAYVNIDVDGCKIESGKDNSYGTIITENSQKNTNIAIGNRVNAGENLIYYKITKLGYYDKTGSLPVKVNKGNSIISYSPSEQTMIAQNSQLIYSLKDNIGDGSISIINTTGSGGLASVLSNGNVQINRVGTNAGKIILTLQKKETENWLPATTTIIANIDQSRIQVNISMVGYGGTVGVSSTISRGSFTISPPVPRSGISLTLWVQDREINSRRYDKSFTYDETTGRGIIYAWRENYNAGGYDLIAKINVNYGIYYGEASCVLGQTMNQQD